MPKDFGRTTGAGGRDARQAGLGGTNETYIYSDAEIAVSDSLDLSDNNIARTGTHTYVANDGDYVKRYWVYAAASSGTPTVRMTVYDVDESGIPVNLLSPSAEASIELSTTPGWHSSLAVNIPLLKFVTYCVVVGAADTSNPIDLYYNGVGEANARSIDTITEGTFPSVWNHDGFSTTQYMMYAEVWNDGIDLRNVLSDATIFVTETETILSDSYISLPDSATISSDAFIRYDIRSDAELTGIASGLIQSDAQIYTYLGDPGGSSVGKTCWQWSPTSTSLVARVNPASVRYTANAGDYVKKIWLYVDHSVSAHTAQAAIYQYEGGVPTTKQGTEATVTGITTTGGWRSSGDVKIPLLAGSTYVVATGEGDGVSTNYCLHYKGTSEANARSSDSTSGALPATWVQFNLTNTQYMMYAEVWNDGTVATIASDGHIQGTFTEPIYSDAELLGTHYLTILSDAWIEYKFFSDAWIEIAILSHAYIKGIETSALITSTFTVSEILTATILSNAYISGGFEQRDIFSGGHIWDTFTTTILSDAHIQRTDTVVILSGGHVQRTDTVTIGSDAFIATEIGSDSFIATTISSDAFIDTEITSNAFIVVTIPSDTFIAIGIDSDAFIATRIFSNAVIFDVTTSERDSDAFISIGLLSDAQIQLVNQTLLLSAAEITKESISADAFIETLILSDAYISDEILSDALIFTTDTKTILSDSRIYIADTITIFSDSHVQRTDTVTILSAGNIQKPFTVTIGSDAFISTKITSNAVIVEGDLKAISSNATIFVTDTKTILSAATIFLTGSVNVFSDAKIVDAIRSDASIFREDQSDMLSDTVLFDSDFSDFFSDAELTRETILSSAYLLGIDVVYEIPARIDAHLRVPIRIDSSGGKDSGRSIL